jgi:5-methyltetrahydrofolate--homocysteine methyltransferase
MRGGQVVLFDNYSTYIIGDGAMGTMLQKIGLGHGERSDIMNITSPESVENIHRMYVDAGSEIIYTNTFGANADILHESGYSPEEIISKAVDCAKRAGGSGVLIALDIGPVGALLEPMGSIHTNKAYELFREQAILGETAGVDLVVIETMSDIIELSAAILAVSENTNLPIIATMTFDNTGHTYTGCTPEELVEIAHKHGVTAVGINCSLAPYEIYATVERLAKATSLPLVIKPNAGLPTGANGTYSIDPAEFAIQMLELANIVHKTDEINLFSKDKGTPRRIIIGGCCGTTPDYIREIRRVFT